jgi:hypothetical protein
MVEERGANVLLYDVGCIRAGAIQHEERFFSLFPSCSMQDMQSDSPLCWWFDYPVPVLCD